MMIFQVHFPQASFLALVLEEAVSPSSLNANGDYLETKIWKPEAKGYHFSNVEN